MRAGLKTKSRPRGSVLSAAVKSSREFVASASPNFLVLCGFFVIVLFMGGSARPDVLSLVVLRPLAVLVFAYGLVTLRRGHLAGHMFMFAMAAAIFALVLAYLIPLPPAIWSALSGRGLIVDIDREAGLGAVWRPLSMAPDLTWNALWSLFIPLAVLVHGVQLRREEGKQFLLLVIVGCAVSSMVALLQLRGAPDGPLYLYRITNSGAAVGLFANRNHQALFLACSLPMLAAYGAPRGHSRRRDRRRLFVCFAFTLLVLPLLLVTGSRAGLAVGVIGLLSMPLIYGAGVPVRSRKRAPYRLWAAAGLMLLAVVVTAWAVWAGRAEAIRRALSTVPGQELRYEKWTAVIAHLGEFLPFGSGPGSYEPVFQAIEPASLLASSYSNHAHNDWLEILMTAGLPGAFLLAVAVVGFGVAVLRAILLRRRNEDAAFAFAGIFIVFMIAVASAVDYPVRTPIVAALLVIACLWAGVRHTASVAGRARTTGA